MAELLLPNSGFDVRTINSGERLPIRGYGLQVLDGGLRRHKNVLSIGRNLPGGTDPSDVTKQALTCAVGNALVADFDYVALPLGSNALDVDRVKLLIATTRNAVFTDGRKADTFTHRGLARGVSSVITAGSCAKLYSSNDETQPIEVDDYHTDSQNRDDGFFDGWITGNQTFRVWIMVATANSLTTNGEFYPLVGATATDRSTAPAAGMGTHHNAGYTYNFGWGATGLTSTVTVPIQCPGGAYEIWVENTSVSGLTVRYQIGVRSRL